MTLKSHAFVGLLTATQLALLTACVDSDNHRATVIPPAPDAPAVYVDTSSVVEGDSGPSTLRFVVSLNTRLDGPVSVDWTTRDGSADQSDYQQAGGTLVFPAGVTQAEGLVTVFGDTDPEYTESFDISLSGLRNNSSKQVTYGRMSAKALIVNDDGYYLNIQPLNDTGVIACEVANSNRPQSCSSQLSYADQDAHYGRDAKAMAGELYKDGGGWAGFDFTKLDSNGDDIGRHARQWDCVRDNRTGLIWEVKTDDGGLRDRFNTYSWFFDDGEVLTGGDAGTADAGSCQGGINCDTQAYIAAINSLQLCGRGEHWRLPTPEELRSINDYSRGYNTRPTLDIDYFPNDPAVVDSSLYSTGVWSLLSYFPEVDSTVLDRALGFSFQHGTLLSAQKSPNEQNAVDVLYVRLVNGS